MSALVRNIAIRFMGFASLVLSLVFQTEWMIMEQQFHPTIFSYSINQSYIYPAFVFHFALQSWWLIDYAKFATSRKESEEQVSLVLEDTAMQKPICQSYMPILVLSNICLGKFFTIPFRAETHTASSHLDNLLHCPALFVRFSGRDLQRLRSTLRCLWCASSDKTVRRLSGALWDDFDPI
jgi:hypothetical protein